MVQNLKPGTGEKDCFVEGVRPLLRKATTGLPAVVGWAWPKVMHHSARILPEKNERLVTFCRVGLQVVSLNNPREII